MEQPFSLRRICLGVVFLTTLVYLYGQCSPSIPSNDLPLINGKKRFEFTDLFARKRFLFDAENIIKQGLAKASVFETITEDGRQTVLDPRHVDEIRNLVCLNHLKSLVSGFHISVAGFEQNVFAVENYDLLHQTIRTKLTQNLDKLSEGLSREVGDALLSNWTDESGWHTVHAKDTVLALISQISSFIFLGDEICRNPDWLHVASNYAVDFMQGSIELRIFPSFLKPLVARFLPGCTRLRADVKQAHALIEPLVEKRRRARATAIKEGREPETYLDLVQWFEECATDRDYSPVHAQLVLSAAAIHTTADMLTQVLYDLSGREELVEALREEIRAVVPLEGLKKPALYKLRLMDSVMKESQRLKPISMVSMRRVAESPVNLSNGITLPTGTKLFVSSYRQWDENYYPDAGTFDPYRFYRLRENNADPESSSAQLVSTSANNLSFGIGRHACPGRHFAAHALKIALCHILTKYDFRVVGKTPKVMVLGAMMGADPKGVLEVRRREEVLASPIA